MGLRTGSTRRLRLGDVVDVRTGAEILATLDANASLDNMPFMPEMLQYIGRRYKVSRRVDKICDTIAYTGSRRMRATVYLEDLRCDGSGHAGCQAGCRLYWNEAWLRRVDKSDRPANAPMQDEAAAKLEILTRVSARSLRQLKGNDTEVWRCQATEALNASKRLRGYDLRQYWRELTNGNFRPVKFFLILARGFIMEVAGRFDLVRRLPLRGSSKEPSPRAPLNLQPGDLVQVRSPAEIVTTLDENGLNYGLSFDREMLPFCGRTLRVKARVRNIVDDKTGRMLNIRRDCLVLEGAVCSGESSLGCWFCPREIHAYWREAWLRRVEPVAQQLNDPNAHKHRRDFVSESNEPNRCTRPS